MVYQVQGQDFEEQPLTTIHPPTVPPQTVNEYADLKRLMREHGLLEKNPRAYIFKFILLASLFSLSIAFLIVVGPSWFQLLNAAFLAFVSTQLGLLGHEAGHRQIFHKTWKNDVVGMTAGTFLLGLSQQWWMDKHNRHHSNPNQHDLDPDIDIPFLSFTEEDISTRPLFTQFIVRHQALLFFPMTCLVGLDLQIKTMQFLWHTRENYHTTEVALLLAHFVGLFGLLIWRLGVGPALLFMLVFQMLWGLYLGSIFAPNHKGMPILEKENSLSFLRRQILTARNVRSHPIIDFWYGGLNYQIEHHLFPSMPQKNLRAAKILVEHFCKERSIPYHETGMRQSYVEILQSLAAMSLIYRARG